MARSLAFLKSKPTPVTVNGEIINFYPLSLNAVHLLKGFVGPVSGAISTLFAKTDTDTGRQFDEFASKEEGMASSKTKIEPVSVDMARFRSQQREAAIKTLMDTLTDPGRHRELMLIITDSMRDEFPVKPNDNQLADFMLNTDVPSAIELFKGVLKANGGLFDPLVSRVTEAMKDQTSPPSPLLQFPDSQSRAETAGTNQSRSGNTEPQSNAS